MRVPAVDMAEAAPLATSKMAGHTRPMERLADFDISRWGWLHPRDHFAPIVGGEPLSPESLTSPCTFGFVRGQPALPPTSMASTDQSSSELNRPPKIRHEWFQTDQEVVISIFVRNLTSDALSCDIAPTSLSILYKLPSATGHSEASFDLDPLQHDIVPDQSSYKALSSKIEVKLKKLKVGVKWSKLEREQGEEVVTTESTRLNPQQQSSSAPSYPSSSRSGRKDWDKLGNEAEADEVNTKEAFSKDPNAGGDKDLNELFKKIYAGATDDQRMAMMKSYQESNGTALSTDWQDVQKGKVETKPPDSMVAKKWGK